MTSSVPAVFKVVGGVGVLAGYTLMWFGAKIGTSLTMSVGEQWQGVLLVAIGGALFVAGCKAIFK